LQISSSAIDIAVMSFWLKAAFCKKGMMVAMALPDEHRAQNRWVVYDKQERPGCSERNTLTETIPPGP
jgi:hypothetical protein